MRGEIYNMFNKQLKHNIKALDAQIGKLGKEIEELQNDNKYEVKMRTLSDLTDLRSKLTKDKDSDKSDVVIEIDKQIEELASLIAKVEFDDTYSTKMKQLEELTKVRCLLAESKLKGSYTSEIITGVASISAILLILKYEQTDILTSKSINIAMKLFRGK
jgi:hypothetical protein